MFTGLVTTLGTLASCRSRGAGLSIVVRHELPGAPLASGESVAVDGCCLTVVRAEPDRFSADVSPESLSRTGGRSRWRAGRVLNLERAVIAGERLGGHIVQGHADGLVRVLGLRRRGGGWVDLRMDAPPRSESFLVLKGSVALDGVSLTVARRGPRWFEVALTPATMSSTTLSRRRPGDRMIVEWDVLARFAGAARSHGAAAAR